MSFIDDDPRQHVVEIFSPDRFKGEARRQGLRSGMSFDTRLGSEFDVLTPKGEKRLWNYLNLKNPKLS